MRLELDDKYDIDGCAFLKRQCLGKSWKFFSGFF